MWVQPLVQQQEHHEQERHRGGSERHHQAGVEWAGDQVGKEGLAGERFGVDSGQRKLDATYKLSKCIKIAQLYLARAARRCCARCCYERVARR